MKIGLFVKDFAIGKKFSSMVFQQKAALNFMRKIMLCS